MKNREGLADEITRLSQLRADGILLEEEFKSAKASLLLDRLPKDTPEEVRLPTSRQVFRLGLGVAFRAFLMLYVVLPLALVLLIFIILWFVRTFG